MTWPARTRIYDPRIPSAETCVTGHLLERRARETPDKLFGLFQDGSTWTYSQALDIVQRTAFGLQALGVRRGDTVNVWLPNHAETIAIWLAINYLGAVYVPINLAYRGRILEHVIENGGASLLILHGDLASRLNEISLARLSDLLIVGELVGDVPAALRVHSASRLRESGERVLQAADVAPWDTAAVIYTSGTTGPSKGVLTSYVQNFSSTEYGFSYLTSDDRFLVNLPLYHVSGMGGVTIPLKTGGSFALVDSFKTDEFWSVVRRTQSTTVILLGVMANFLMKQAESPEDRRHPLRSVMMVPLSEDSAQFNRRFGCDVYTVFNMTEISSPLVAGPNPGPVGTCGKPRPGVEVRLVDDNDCEVAPGDVGQLILRTDRPWAMNHGYLRNETATTAAWRNGWFHTGDAFRVDADGNYFFVDRMKDAIRRRGENISSVEVETEVCAHPLVREAAAVAVPSPEGEDEVLVVVAPATSERIDPTELITFLIPRLPHFMVPRYVRVVDELPKTPTQKVQKHLLRAEGVGEAFDRTAAGIKLRNEKLTINA